MTQPRNLHDILASELDLSYPLPIDDLIDDCDDLVMDCRELALEECE